ncbi:hypothetical protein [Methanosarcina sp.]|uniref:hypothetical protein n=1 Tax=Methanosarcina sp. TaxID=2213 RepID=UPI003C72E9C5
MIKNPWQRRDQPAQRKPFPKRLDRKPFQKRFDRKPLATLVVEIAYNPKTLSGVIKRRNVCGSTVVGQRFSGLQVFFVILRI